MISSRKKLIREKSLLIVAASEGDANMLYATGFFAPDPFIFFQYRGKRYAVMSDLEIDRAKKEAHVNFVYSISQYQRKVKQRGKMGVSTADILELIFNEKRVQTLLVPANFPLFLADNLRKKGFRLNVTQDPYFANREKKNTAEVKKIRDSIRVAEIGLAAGIDILKKAKIGKDRYLYIRGRRLTSEQVKTIVNTTIMAQGWVPSHTIIAGGNQGCDPHCEGYGPLKAHESIIFDIFPRSQRTGYYGDLSRTVVRGRASERLREAFHTVRQGQEMAFSVIRDGMDGQNVHQKITEMFTERGFVTGKIDGRMQGFFHGTGHGLGLDIHEPPRIGMAHSILRSGHVVTVEPGLYYLGMGGVRLEDVVLVLEKGNRNLTIFPKYLEI